jgi:hypothetical protein
MDEQQAKQVIDMVIKAWSMRFPAEFKAFMGFIHEEQMAQVNSFASNKSKTMRHGVSLPQGLDTEIEKRFPEIFKDKKQFRWFMGAFPMFRVCDKI